MIQWAPMYGITYIDPYVVLMYLWKGLGIAVVIIAAIAVAGEVFFGDRSGTD